MSHVGIHKSSAPRSLFDDTDESRRHLLKEECAEVFERVMSMTHGGGDTSVTITGDWSGHLRWARNRIISSGDVRDVRVRISRRVNGAVNNATATSLDDIALRAAVQNAEWYVRLSHRSSNLPPLPGAQQYLQPLLWSDSTYRLSAEARSAAAQRLVDPAVAANLMAAGYADVRAETHSIFNSAGMNTYFANTAAEYSVTARTPDGSASGWAGRHHFDWDALNADALTAAALDKCRTGQSSKFIEPGRYSVILEPQAVHDIMRHAVNAMDRVWAERSTTAYSLEPGRSRIGLQICDPRVTISTNPMDRDGGYIPFDNDGTPYQAVEWVKNGVLNELPYSRWYAIAELGRDAGLPNPRAYRMSGGSSSVAQMIENTWRGLLVTRLHDVTVIDGPTLQCTGTTRDGVWLIEKGRITTPVRNLRFNESPLFVLNNILAMGEPVRVYSDRPAVVPPLHVQDFNFNGVSHAI